MFSRRLYLMIVTLLLCAGALGLPSRSQAQSSPAVVQLGVEPAFDGRYRGGSWMPFRITVSNDGPDVNAVVSVFTTAAFQAGVELPRGANKSLTVYAQAPAAFQRSVAVRVLADGTELAKAEVPVTSIPSTTQVIGLMSEVPLALPMPESTASRKLELVPVRPAELPERREGLSLFDVLVVDGALPTALTPAQQQALHDWVATGGQLVLGGTQLDQVLAPLPESLRPATVGEAVPPAPLAIFPELGAALPALTALHPIGDARAFAVVGSTAVGVQRDLGAGRVTALGFSLSASELARSTPESTFWPQILRFRTTLPEMMGVPQPDDMQAQQLGFALMTLPVLAIPPLGVLAGLLAAYVLIVGPILYLVLRRLDRQAWGWVAIPLVTLLFSLGAYGYGLRLRGNDVILNQISVVEPHAGRARVRTYAGLFSPRTATYAVETDGEALFKPLPNGDFGMPAGATGGSQYVQGSGAVRDLAVAQWSMSTFAAEQMADADLFEYDLALVEGVLRGSVRNKGLSTLRDVALVQNMRVVKIGDLEPGAVRDVELKLDDMPPIDWGGSPSMLLLRDRWDFNKPIQPPADIRMQMMILDALFNTPYDRPTAPMLLGWLDEAPIALHIADGRVHQQQLTLVMAPAQVDFTPGTRVQLPRGWLKGSLEAGNISGGPCITPWGPGWYVDGGMLTSTMQLPSKLHDLQIEQATAYIHFEGMAPMASPFEVYDWQAAQWVPHNGANNSAVLAAPQRFFSSSGLFKMRLDWEHSELNGKGGACVSMDVSVEGTQP